MVAALLERRRLEWLGRWEEGDIIFLLVVVIFVFVVVVILCTYVKPGGRLIGFAIDCES